MLTEQLPLGCCGDPQGQEPLLEPSGPSPVQLPSFLGPFWKVMGSHVTCRGPCSSTASTAMGIRLGCIRKTCCFEGAPSGTRRQWLALSSMQVGTGCTLDRVLPHCDACSPIPLPHFNPTLRAEFTHSKKLGDPGQQGNVQARTVLIVPQPNRFWCLLPHTHTFLFIHFTVVCYNGLFISESILTKVLR